MTATTVNGIDVLRDEPTLAPITSRDGKPVYWQQTRTLTLADGSVVYGCAHCDYTADKAGAIRPHLKTHAAKTVVPKSSGDLSLSDVLNRLSAADQVQADRDQWRTRALKAERSLATMRKALGVNG
ncbi:hypothetical protein [Actinokineospora enzanensis]|uniref:hypothetical protein n=1 Tax=Actinokineospora enzanensis TaxID=155975 RepID=UPI0003A502F7|nr:hypothetical protein [Actinokineospora enzanensis]